MDRNGGPRAQQNTPRITRKTVVRDDASGSVRRRLQTCIDEAGELKHLGRALRKESELEPWIERCRDWRRSTAEALGCHFEREAVEEFLWATREQRTDTYSDRLRDDLDALGNAIELVVSLQHTLSAGGISRRDIERGAAGTSRPAPGNQGDVEGQTWSNEAGDGEGAWSDGASGHRDVETQTWSEAW